MLKKKVCIPRRQILLTIHKMKFNDYLNETATCQNEPLKEDCSVYLKKYYTLMHLPFEVSKGIYGNDIVYGNIGFGTYLAYFSQILSTPEKNFLMNYEMTEDEKETRKYMNQVLGNLAKSQKIGNISLIELVNFLHSNPNENYQHFFAGHLQNELACDMYFEAHLYSLAWMNFAKAYIFCTLKELYYKSRDGLKSKPFVIQKLNLTFTGFGWLF